MATQKDIYAQFAYEQALRLGGGAGNFSEFTKAQIWAECQRNESIKTRAGMYLVGSSNRAKHNLDTLDILLRKVFGFAEPESELVG
jgi:hypothetical protein